MIYAYIAGIVGTLLIVEFILRKTPWRWIASKMSPMQIGIVAGGVLTTICATGWMIFGPPIWPLWLVGGVLVFAIIPAILEA